VYTGVKETEMITFSSLLPSPLLYVKGRGGTRPCPSRVRAGGHVVCMSRCGVGTPNLHRCPLLVM
jgi:hypothetical protein